LNLPNVQSGRPVSSTVNRNRKNVKLETMVTMGNIFNPAEDIYSSSEENFSTPSVKHIKKYAMLHTYFLKLFSGTISLIYLVNIIEYKFITV
jgi:hypothetical protein